MRRRNFPPHAGRHVEKHLVIFFRPQRRHDAGHRRVVGQAQLPPQRRVRRLRAKALDIDAVGDDMNSLGRKLFMLDQILAMRRGARAMKASVSGVSQ